MQRQVQEKVNLSHVDWFHFEIEKKLRQKARQKEDDHDAKDVEGENVLSIAKKGVILLFMSVGVSGKGALRNDVHGVAAHWFSSLKRFSRAGLLLE